MSLNEKIIHRAYDKKKLSKKDRNQMIKIVEKGELDNTQIWEMICSKIGV